MSGLWAPLAGLIVAIVGLAIYWYRAAQREAVRQRLKSSDLEEVLRSTQNRPFSRRHPIVPWLIALPLGILLIWLWSWPINITVGLVLVAAFIGIEIDAWIHQWRLARMEAQLAEVIDILVASVSAGASIQTSLAQAAEFAPRPIRGEFAELVARMRLGDSPNDAFVILQQRLPTEVFRLFATTLTVNWRVGGELSGTLASIGGAVRDRLAIARQLRTLSTQGTLTTVVVLGIVWFMAGMMWQSDPRRFANFVQSDMGSWLIAVCLGLQGIGVALVSRIIRPKI